MTQKEKGAADTTPENRELNKSILPSNISAVKVAFDEMDRDFIEEKHKSIRMIRGED